MFETNILTSLATWGKCPGCNYFGSIYLHDFSLCSQLRNAEYRIRDLEKRLEGK